MIFYLIFNQAPLVIAAAIYEYKQITKQTSQFHNTCIHITSLLSAGMLHVCKNTWSKFLVDNMYKGFCSFLRSSFNWFLSDCHTVWILFRIILPPYFNFDKNLQINTFTCTLSWYYRTWFKYSFRISLFFISKNET